MGLEREDDDDELVGLSLSLGLPHNSDKKKKKKTTNASPSAASASHSASPSPPPPSLDLNLSPAGRAIARHNASEPMQLQAHQHRISWNLLFQPASGQYTYIYTHTFPSLMAYYVFRL
ncbi:hypothetical protein CRG98_034539 [Punica granatum]|uniref:Uncharacterized protein n=1 Tax=Punica granatum TaxID=22663 RepID=A0A2I0IM39_PUNGR|nr:hypothetical protein CRG98_034539 [Punica granatum]